MWVTSSFSLPLISFSMTIDHLPVARFSLFGQL